MSIRAVLAVVCLFSFSQTLSAFSSGPPANRNGVGGVYCVACHRTNELNSGDGSVRVLGLPSAWLPGETYTLRVMVSHPTAIRFGFEFSAVGPNGDQAGELIPDSDGRTFVQIGNVNGKNVQFIEHTSVGSAIGSPNFFQFSYRTPTDASFGTIRINLAGNAANGNGASTGDFIYAIEVALPVLVASNTRPFAMATRGGLSMATLGTASAANVGFARMVTSSGTAGVGLSFVSYRQGNVLVSDSALPASSPIRSGRIYTEIGGAVNTAMALVNPNSQPAVVSLGFTDDNGSDFGQSSITIAPNSRVAAFLNQQLFFTPNPFQRAVGDARTFTFSSNLPVSAFAIRTRFNERGEFMMTTLPVADVAASSAAATSISHVVDGGGWTTEVLLVNSTDTAETGTLRFLSSSGQAMTVSADGQSNNQFSYSVPARSSRRFRTSGSSAPTAIGWVEVNPATNSRTPSAAAVLIEKTSGITVSETTIQSSSATNAARVYAEASGNFGSREARSIQTGVAISNAAGTSVSATLELTNLDGTVLAATTLSIPARGQAGLLLGDIPGLKLSAPFTGILWVSTPTGSALAVSGLRARYNERQDFLVTAFPSSDEAGAGSSELVFPQLIDSSGYSTQFVLMGVRGGQCAGNLQFISQTGDPLGLLMR